MSANSLLPTEVGTNIKTVSQAYSAGLWRLLTDANNAGAVRLIAMNPTLRSENERLYSLIHARSAPIEQPILLAKLIEQAVVFGVQAKDDAEWAVVLGVYLDALAQVPEEAITEAFERWNRSELYPKEPGRHAFFPKPAELYSLAQNHMNAIRMAAWRAKKALEQMEATKTREKTPEDIAAIKAMLAEFKGAPKAMPEDPPCPRETPQQLAQRLRDASVTPTGPSGLTALMRERMGLGPEKVSGPKDDGDVGFVL